MNEASRKNKMTSVKPRTIVITALPAGSKRPLSAVVQPQVPRAVPAIVHDHHLDVMDDDFSGTDEGGPRKRKRLTHLSADQRLLRRKLKNRVAAQTARDRKKLRMQELEEAVAALEAENKRLQNENSSLKLQTGVLSQQNTVLRKQLGHNEEICEIAPSDQEGSLKSAALRSPQQQGRILPVSRATSRYLTLLLTLSLTSLACSNKSLTAQSQMKLKKLSQPVLLKLSSPQFNQIKHRKWWGPQQQSWNPSKN